MKAIILAAGYATRLWPLTKDTPKPLLPVKDRPIAEYIIDKIAEIEEIDEIFIVTNDKFYGKFLEWQKTLKIPLRIKIINDLTKNNEDRLGSLGDIKFVMEKENLNDDLLIIAGDNLFEFSLLDVYRRYTQKGKATIALYDVVDTELAKLYGIVAIDDHHKVIHFEEKPPIPRSTLSSTGIYFYPKETAWKLVHFVNMSGKKDKAGDFLEWLYKEDEVYAYVTTANWFDIGSLDQLEKANREFMQKSSSRTVVVTGGAGFIGSHLCDYLISKGDYVICVDNLMTGSKKNISHLMSDPKFHFLEHDVTKPLFIDRKIDQIYNLACPGFNLHHAANPVKTIKASTVGVINILGLAESHKARVLQASSSGVYGDALEHPQKETYRGNVDPLGALACYQEGKRAAESIFIDYNRQNGVDIRIVRLFDTYGPRMPKDSMITSRFIARALKGDDLVVDAADHMLSICYVSDVVEGMYRMMNQEQEAGPVNIGNPLAFPAADFAKKIREISSSVSKISIGSNPMNRQVILPDIDHAKKLLRWHPTTPLELGLKKTIDFFRQS